MWYVRRGDLISFLYCAAADGTIMVDDKVHIVGCFWCLLKSCICIRSNATEYDMLKDDSSLWLEISQECPKTVLAVTGKLLGGIRLYYGKEFGLHKESNFCTN